MTDDADLPGVEELLASTLHDLNHAHGVLSKAASRLQLAGQPIRSALTPAQRRARTAASGAIDDAKAAIDRAKNALYDALRTDDPPRP